MNDRPIEAATLHQQIMNLPCGLPNEFAYPSEVKAYQQGHRDARHAAAALVLASAPIEAAQTSAEPCKDESECQWHPWCKKGCQKLASAPPAAVPKPYGYVVMGHFYPSEKAANSAAWALSMTAGEKLPITPVFLSTPTAQKAELAPEPPEERRARLKVALADVFGWKAEGGEVPALQWSKARELHIDAWGRGSPKAHAYIDGAAIRIEATNGADVWFGLAPAPWVARPTPAAAARRPTDDELREWADRHDLESIGLSELRCIFEDAQTLIPAAAAAGVPPEPAKLAAGVKTCGEGQQ